MYFSIIIFKYTWKLDCWIIQPPRKIHHYEIHIYGITIICQLWTIQMDYPQIYVLWIFHFNILSQQMDNPRHGNFHG